MLKTKLTLMTIFMLLTITTCVQWYQNSKNIHLNWQNFDNLVTQHGKYKFVKFYTRTCRYCRLLNIVLDQLRTQKQWSFLFYDVDCTQHYDLCKSKATISGFPYVGIYNDKGELETDIKGYYQIETMRQIFQEIQRVDLLIKEQYKTVENKSPKTIELTQQKKHQLLKNNDVPIAMHVQTTKTDKHINPSKISQNHQKTQTKVPQKTQTTIHQKKSQTTVHKKQTNNDDQDGLFTKGSFQNGFKLCIILLGYYFFNKVIGPYIKHDQTYSSSRTIQLPIKKNDDVQESKWLNQEIKL